MKHHHHILVADGNPYVAGILEQTLGRDFRITVAHSGQDAIRLLIQGTRFDCVLTELNLPHFSGLELTKLIRMNKLIGHLPVVILSDTTDSNTRITCLEEGVDGFIAKPFNPLEVKAKLHALLRRAGVPVADLNSLQQLRTTGPFTQLKSRILSLLL